MKRVVLILAACVAACSAKPQDTLAGYGEGQYVYVSSLDPGRIEALYVAEGDSVEAGAVLARLDAGRAADSAASANAQAAAAAVRSTGALADAVRRADADAALAHANLVRAQALFARGFVAKARIDADAAAARAADAAAAQARAEQRAAGGETRAAAAEARLARTRVADMALAAPAAGRIERIFHRPGEVVAAGTPVLELLPPANMKIRFFAPQAMLSRLKPGTRLAVSCDGCAANLQARVSFVAREPQFTPPVIYSLDERDRLVFLVEAIPDDPAAIRPGQPVDIHTP
jgi:HlyD family secretion protein